MGGAMNIDPLTLAVVRGGIEQVVEEMDLTLKRTAFSPVISDANDMANGLYHPRTGEVIAQGKWGLPTFVGIMQFTTQAVIQEAERSGMGGWVLHGGKIPPNMFDEAGVHRGHHQVLRLIHTGVDFGGGLQRPQKEPGADEQDER